MTTRLQQLNPDLAVRVDVQQTSFSHDLLGRYTCNTWDEVVNNGGEPFDVVVIGAGMYGGYIADKIYLAGDGIGLRVLVLDGGGFLAPTHLQNLPKIGVSVPAQTIGPVTGNDKDPGPQSIVWGYPWHSAQNCPGLAYCMGGRSIFWGGWSPRLTAADLSNPLWPSDVVTFLNTTYPDVEKEIGVTPTADFISGGLFSALLTAFQAAAPSGVTVAEAPLAVQGKADQSGLFAFDKYSSAYLLLDAIREDIARRLRIDSFGNPINGFRRLMWLPRPHVARLRVTGTAVSAIELSVDGKAQPPLTAPLLSPNCTVVLALSTIESTRLALESFPSAPMGANLMAHLRSNITIRIKRNLFPSLPPNPQDLETAALIVRGTPSNNRRYHIQVTAGAIHGPNPEQNLFTAMPDLDLLNQVRANQDPDYIVLVLRCIGEMIGDTTIRPSDPTIAPNPGKSWINLTNPNAPNQNDLTNNHRRAWVNLVPTAADNAAWTEIEQKALSLAQSVVQTAKGGPIAPGDLQYWDDAGLWSNVSEQWTNSAPTPPLPLRPNNGRDLVGSTHHEAGTLWMGSPGASVADSFGKLHHLDNVRIAGPALFPTIGSANPSLTGMALARRTARVIVDRYTPAPSAAFKSLYN